MLAASSAGASAAAGAAAAGVGGVSGAVAGAVAETGADNWVAGLDAAIVVAATGAGAAATGLAVTASTDLTAGGTAEDDDLELGDIGGRGIGFAAALVDDGSAGFAGGDNDSDSERDGA